MLSRLCPFVHGSICKSQPPSKVCRALSFELITFTTFFSVKKPQFYALWKMNEDSVSDNWVFLPHL